MSDCMTFPDTVEDFMEQYKVVDTDCVYSNGIEFVPIFRMKQWFEHLQDAQEVQPDRMKLVQQAVNTIMNTSRSYSIRDRAFRNAARFVQCAIDGEAPDFEQIPEGDEMPSAQAEPTLEQIEEYCHKRCLSIVDNALLHKYAQSEIQPEIIRCKDCKYHRQNDYGDSWCAHSKGLDQFDLKPTDFCSRAERITDGTEQP